MSALEILDEVLLGQTTHHRRTDAWDLLDAQQHVAAVICVRKASGFVTISLPSGPEREGLKPHGPIVMPYDEEVVAHVTYDGTSPKGQRKQDTVLLSAQQACELVARLVEVPTLSRAEGTKIAAEIAARG